MQWTLMHWKSSILFEEIAQPVLKRRLGQIIPRVQRTVLSRELSMNPCMVFLAM